LRKILIHLVKDSSNQTFLKYWKRITIILPTLRDGLKHTNYNSDIRKYTKETDPITQLLKLKILPPTDGKPLEYKYKYNGKEWQDELGLNFYDYGARNYDPAIGRWMNIDALSEEFSDYSPFVYVFNNPVRHIDPDGNAPEDRLGETDPPGKKKQQTTISFPTDLKQSTTVNAGYPGQALDELITSGIQWLGEKISGSNVSKETSENVQLGTSVLVVIVSKGKNAKADTEVVEQLTKTEVKGASNSAKSGTGRGSNNRTADPDAVGDHTVINERGSTTYKTNPNNPNKNNKGVGFETQKRVDYKGAAHVDKKTGVKTPTPHVQENGAVRRAIPGKDMPK
jgi:RHS repeat-associated protein